LYSSSRWLFVSLICIGDDDDDDKLKDDDDDDDEAIEALKPPGRIFISGIKSTANTPIDQPPG